MFKVFLLWVLPIALTVYAVVDCAIDDEVERTGIPKLFWIIMIVLIPYVGPLSWLIVSKFAKPRTRRSRPGWGARPRPVAPDDNPRFLREWAEEQARKERERRRLERGEGGDDSAPPPPSTDR